MIFRYEMWDHTNMTGKQKGDHMNQSMIAQNIRANGLRATAQRILIYQYLFEHRTHPDAGRGLSCDVRGWAENDVGNGI